MKKKLLKALKIQRNKRRNQNHGEKARTKRHISILITTRYDFDPLEGRLASGIEHISLPELHFPQTNWLMNNFTKLANFDIPKKRKIYNVIGGHPWTIGQFAKHAAVQGVDELLLDL